MVGGSPRCFSTFGHFTFRRFDQNSPEIRGRNWVVGLPKNFTTKFKGGGAICCQTLGGCTPSMIPLDGKNILHPTCMKPSKSWDMGIFTISTDAEFLPSVSMISIPLNHPIYPFPTGLQELHQAMSSRSQLKGAEFMGWNHSKKHHDFLFGLNSVELVQFWRPWLLDHLTTLGSLKILDVFCRIGAWRLSQHSFHFSHRHRNWSSPRRISNGSLDQKISPSTFPPGPFGPCHLSPEAHNSTDATGRSEPPWRFTFCRTLGVGHINQVFTISPLDADFGAEKVFPLIGGGHAVFCSVEFPEVRVPAEVWELLGMKQSWWTMVDSFTSFSGMFWGISYQNPGVVLVLLWSVQSIMILYAFRNTKQLSCQATYATSGSSAALPAASSFTVTRPQKLQTGTNHKSQGFSSVWSLHG